MRTKKTGIKIILEQNYKYFLLFTFYKTMVLVETKVQILCLKSKNSKIWLILKSLGSPTTTSNNHPNQNSQKAKSKILDKKIQRS